QLRVGRPFQAGTHAREAAVDELQKNGPHRVRRSPLPLPALAALVRSRAPEERLDTYTAERHPVAARVLANTRAQVALMRPDDLTTALREIVAQILSLDEANRFFGEMM